MVQTHVIIILKAMDVIPSDGMNHPVEGLASRMQVDCEAKYKQDLGSEECENQIMACGLVHIRHSQQVTQFILADPSRLLGLHLD